MSDETGPDTPDDDSASVSGEEGKEPVGDAAPEKPPTSEVSGVAKGVAVAVVTALVVEGARRLFFPSKPVPQMPAKARIAATVSLNGKPNEAFEGPSLPRGHDWVWRISWKRNVANSEWQESTYRLWNGGERVVLDLDPGEWFISGSLGFDHRTTGPTWIAYSGEVYAEQYDSGAEYRLTIPIGVMESGSAVDLFWSIVRSDKCPRCPWYT